MQNVTANCLSYILSTKSVKWYIAELIIFLTAFISDSLQQHKNIFIKKSI